MRSFLIIALALTALVVMTAGYEYREDDLGDDASADDASADDLRQDDVSSQTGERGNRKFYYFQSKLLFLPFTKEFLKDVLLSKVCPLNLQTFIC